MSSAGRQGVAGLRVILIGCHGFGICWRPGLERTSDISVVAVVDPDEAAMAETGERYGVPRAHRVTRVEDLPDTVRADFVIDSSPFFHHVANAEFTLALGADLVVAKPLASSAKEGEVLLAAAERAGKEVVVAHQMRYFECFRVLRELVRAGRLGKVRHASIEMALDGRGWEPGTAWRLDLEHPLVLEAGVHHVDLVTWVLGADVVAVNARGWCGGNSPFRGTDSVSALLDTDEGFAVHYQASFAPNPVSAIRFDSGWIIEGELGRATVTDGGLRFFDSVDGATSVLVEETAGPAELDVLNAELLADWHGTRSDALCWGSDNLRTLRVLDALRESMGKRQQVEVL